jgi:hypothetical protein
VALCCSCAPLIISFRRPRSIILNIQLVLLLCVSAHIFCLLSRRFGARAIQGPYVIYRRFKQFEQLHAKCKAHGLRVGPSASEAKGLIVWIFGRVTG